MTQVQATGIIRQRGQLTIPETIRSKISWVDVGSVVEISSQKNDEIIVRPYSKKKKAASWKTLWKKMKRVRAFKGKNKNSLSSFIAQDRLKRHSI